jgi:flagellar biosynthetic protein FliR
MLVFMSVNAHHAVIRAIYESYEFVPMGAMAIGGDVIDGLMRLFSDIFVLGFRIAAPIVFTVLLTDVALGIISKAMPQMNVFMVGMPLKILVGLIIIVVTMPAMMLVFGELFKNVELETVNFMRGIGAQ